MANTFTKKYLTELIEGRIAELDSPDAELSTDMKRLKVMREENLVYAAETLIADGQRLIDQLEGALLSYKETESTGNQRALGQATNNLLNMSRPQKHSYQEMSLLEDRIRKAQRQAGGAFPQVEKERLERVKKYVSDSPEDEFSLTLMKTLGFIDIIKKAING